MEILIDAGANLLRQLLQFQQLGLCSGFLLALDLGANLPKIEQQEERPDAQKKQAEHSPQTALLLTNPRRAMIRSCQEGLSARHALPLVGYFRLAAPSKCSAAVPSQRPAGSGVRGSCRRQGWSRRFRAADDIADGRAKFRL